jgi:hypothetical protein
MRVIAEIPHELFKISIHSYNAKYIIKVELDNFEQSYKVTEDSASFEEVKRMVDEEFLNAVFEQFLAMRTAFGNTYSRNINNF